MQFIKKHLCVRFLKVIVLFVLLIFIEGFIFTGVITAFEFESSPPIIQNTDHVSAFDGAEHWQFRDLGGTAYELGQFKGKVIFINIWATWCMPCIYEMQSIQKLYNAFKNEDVVFLIASNENKNTVKKFYEKNNYTFPIYLIDRILPEPFQSPVIPSTFIIDREGKIALKHFSAADWNQQSCHDFIHALLSNELDSSKIAKPFSDSDNNMDVSEMMKDQRLNYARSFATSRLGPFAEQNNLPPDVKTKLIDIGVEEQLKMMDLSSGNIPIQGGINEMNKIRSDCDEKISRLLSEENYAAYKEYQKFENEWVIVSQIKKDLMFHDMKLERDQEQQLVVAMYNDRQDMMAKQMREASQGGVSPAQSQEEMMKKSLEYQKAISSMYVDSAKGILTEPQLQIFKRYFDNQIYMIERSLIERSHLSTKPEK